MGQRRRFVLGMTALVLGMFSVTTQAEETVMKGTNYHHNFKWQGSKVGDVEGHTIGAYENKGVSIHEDGTRAELMIIGTLDRTKGVGTLMGYDIRRYGDGSTLSLKYEGESKKTDAGAMSSGRYVACHGTGRFSGVRCEGTWQGKRLGKSLRVVDWTVNLK